MTKYVGSLPGAADWNERCTQIKDLMSTYLSSEFTFVSDTGTGTARALLYKCPGSERMMKVLYYSGNGRINYLKLDGVNYIGNYTISGVTTAQPYVIIKNEKSGILAFTGGNTYYSVCGVLDSTTIHSCNYTMYPVAGSDAAQVYSLTSFYDSVHSPKLVNGKTIFMPIFAADDMGVTYYNEPWPDLFVASHGMGTVMTNSSFFTVGTTEFFAITTTVALRVNA